MQAGFDWGGAPEPVQPPELDPHAWPVQPDWSPLIQQFAASEVGRALLHRLRRRLGQGAVLYPPQPLRALALTSLAETRVVILGQDPYHGPGQAEGLAFSVAPGLPLPPSLRNIFKELQRDLGLAPPPNGSLVRWAEQGVLLLNSSLTVEDGAAGSHSGWGWEDLSDAVIRRCNTAGKPKVFLLWGAHAQKKAALIDASRHRVLLANHPSPLSASRGPLPFIGCGHFQLANRWLVENGQAPVPW